MTGTAAFWIGWAVGTILAIALVSSLLHGLPAWLNVLLGFVMSVGGGMLAVAIWCDGWERGRGK